MNEPNLDKICAEIGFKLADENRNNAKEFERITNKALGILIEDNLLAYAIWLESEGEIRIISNSFELLRNMNLITGSYGNNKEKLREAILKEISSDISKTLLARQLIERMLIYAKYRAKALQRE